MNAIDTETATRKFSAPGCNTLAIRDEKLEFNGREENVMVSLWKPSKAELTQLIAGGCVVIGILGKIMPPITVSTELIAK